MTLRVGAMILLLALLTALPGLSAVQPVATVLATAGPSTVRRPGASSSVTLTTGNLLYPGDRVGTGKNGKLKLVYSDGSQVTLAENTIIEINRPAPGKKNQSLFSVIAGKIKATLSPGNTVRTRSAAAGVAGTEFVLAVDEAETTTLVVTEGEVYFYNEFGAVTVLASQQSIARLGYAPTKPVTVENADLIVEWALDLERAAIPRERPGAAVGTAALKDRVAKAQTKALANPKDASARRDYGEALLDSRRLEAALSEFQESDRIEPNQPVTLTAIGDTLLELGRLDESKAAYDQALSASPGYARALIGGAYVALRRNKPADAEASAKQAVAADPTSAEAQLALGLALMRQPGKLDQAAKAFETAQSGLPKDYAYQARSWLALCLLDANETSKAVQEAEAAKQANGNSALAHGNLALVYLFSNRGRDAIREAKVAAALNPDSEAASIVLAQSLLAEGRVDSAVSAAARAAALDPGFPQAHYVLGIAYAQRRDYSHAERSLKKSLDLNPAFLPAACTLARVYLRMGRATDAINLLEGLRTQYPDSHEILSTFGEIAYEDGRYQDAIQYYRSAIEKSPNTARYYSDLARAATDVNRLSEAVPAAQRAVALAPDTSEFQAVLGQAYEYSGFDAQAESAYRTALALDGDNALALVKLGFANQEGDARTAGRTTGLTFAQGFMLDPAISNRLLRGGINSETTVGGQSGGGDQALVFRNRGDVGKQHLYLKGDRETDNGDRPNADFTGQFARTEMTLAPGTQSNVYAHVYAQRDVRGLPGMISSPALDDHSQFRFGEYILGYRYRFGDKNHLWLGLFGNDQQQRTWNPNKDTSLILPGISIFGIPIIEPEAKVNSYCGDIEMRLDMDLGAGRRQRSVLTFGVALPTTRALYTSSLFVPSATSDPVYDPDNTGILTERRTYKTSLAYLQWSKRTGDRFWFTTQIRSQRVKSTFRRSMQELTGSTLGMFGDLTTSPPAQDETHILPSISANYVLDSRTLLRLSASKRVTDITSSIFAPTETLLTTEGETLPVGLPDITRTIELDVQRYLAPGESLKLFCFRSVGEGVSYEFGNYSGLPGLLLGNVRRIGLGVRYERRLARCFYGQIGFVGSSTKCEAPDTPWNGATAPYHPNVAASLRLNYVDSHGSKFGIDVNYDGRFYQDTVDTMAGARPTFPGIARVDLTIPRESGLHDQYFLRIRNIFNARQIVYNDLPFDQRAWLIGWTHRM